MSVHGDRGWWHIKTAIDSTTPHVSMCIHTFRNPLLEDAFTTVPLSIDIAEYQNYSVVWRPGSLAYLVDGDVVHRLAQSPSYPIQLMLGVSTFRRGAIARGTVRFLS